MTLKSGKTQINLDLGLLLKQKYFNIFEQHYNSLAQVNNPRVASFDVVHIALPLFT